MRLDAKGFRNQFVLIFVSQFSRVVFRKFIVSLSSSSQVNLIRLLNEFRVDLLDSFFFEKKYGVVDIDSVKGRFFHLHERPIEESVKDDSTNYG